MLVKKAGRRALAGQAGKKVIGQRKAVGLVRKEDVWLKAIGKTKGDIGCKLSFVCQDCSVLPAAVALSI